MDFAAGGNGWFDLSKYNAGCNNNTSLRFRPIAPKPSSASSSVTYDGTRTKRRYLRVNRSKRKPKRTTESSKQIVTLQLLPLDPIRSVSSSTTRCAESWVTVECVTGISTLSSLRTADETRVTLSGDTCPAFISNGWSNEVKWVNDAFKGMVMDGRVVERVAVWLEMKNGVVLFECGAAFRCRVRWRYGSDGEKVVMCDTWRVESGGFAWRLDVCAAALSLGLGAN